MIGGCCVSQLKLAVASLRDLASTGSMQLPCSSVGPHRATITTNHPPSPLPHPPPPQWKLHSPLIALLPYVFVCLILFVILFLERTALYPLSLPLLPCYSPLCSLLFLPSSPPLPSLPLSCCRIFSRSPFKETSCSSLCPRSSTAWRWSASSTTS